MAHAPRNTQKRVRRAPFGHAHSPRTGRHGPTGRGAILARQRADGSSRALCIRAAHGGRASPDSGHQQAARIGDHSKPHLACRPSGRRDFPFRGGGEGAPPQRTGRTLRGAAGRGGTAHRKTEPTGRRGGGGHVGTAPYRPANGDILRRPAFRCPWRLYDEERNHTSTVEERMRNPRRHYQRRVNGQARSPDSGEIGRLGTKTNLDIFLTLEEPHQGDVG